MFGHATFRRWVSFASALPMGPIFLTVLAIHALWLLADTVSQRMAYPFELEWIEGAMAQHVWRILNGLPVYAAPSLDFTANLYTPLFYYLAAAVAWMKAQASVVTLDFGSLRAVSVAATALTLLLLGAFVYREVRSWWAAVLAAGMYGATYTVSGAWMDVGRVDALYVLWLVAAVYLLRTLQNRWQAAGFALCLVLAFYTKQSALIAAAPLCLYQVIFKPLGPYRVAPSLGFVVVLVASVAWWEVHTAGWFSYYTFEVPRGHPTNRNALGEFLWQDLLCAVPAALLCSGIFFVQHWRRGDGLRRDWFYVAVCVSLGATAVATRINQGGYPNNTMPLYALLAIGFALYIQPLFRDGVGSWYKKLVWCLAALQFLMLVYRPQDFVPSREDKQAFERLRETVRGLEGNVYAYESGFLGHLAGKRDFSHGTAFYDLRLSDNKDPRVPVVPAYPADPQLLADLDKFGVKAIILSERKRNVGRAPRSALGPFIFKAHLLPEQPEALWPKSGAAIRPALLYIRE